MILPDKYIPLERSLLGIGGEVLRKLDNPQTVTALWELMRDETEVGSYEHYVLALDLLYTIGAIGLDKGLIARSSSQ